MHKLVLESVGTLKGRVIEGIALTPSVSLNHNIYSAEEIDATRNLNVPLKADWEHTSENIGHVVYTLDPDNHVLKYTATITDEKRASELQEGVHRVSIEANVDEVTESCNRKGCYNLLSGLTMEGIGITQTPGVVQTTMRIVESFQDWKPITDGTCTKCKENAEKEIDSNIELKQQVEQLQKEVEFLKIPKCNNCGKIKK